MDLKTGLKLTQLNLKQNKMKKEESKNPLKELRDAVDSKKDKKGFYPLTDDIYNTVKNNRV